MYDAESNSKEISIGALQGNLLLGLPFSHLISLKELGVCGTVKLGVGPETLVYARKFTHMHYTG